MAARTGRGRKGGKGARTILRRLGKGRATATVAVAVFAALAIGATVGWWGASRVAERPAPISPAVPKMVRQEPPPAPEPTPEPEPEEPEVAALPPPSLPTPVPVPTVPTWRRNAIAFAPEAGKPMIAVVIDDMGVDAKRSARVIAMPPPLTTSFLSYAHNLSAQARAAHAAGHELMLHMPMEPFGAGNDPGPDALFTAMDDAAIRARLRQSLASFSGYVGINNHMGSRFTAEERGMRVVMHELHGDGLLFLDSLTSARSVGVRIADEAGVPNLVRNVFIDDSPDPAAIRAQLRRIEDHARKTGSGIAIGHPRDTTIAALAEWQPQMRAKGFQFVPISALAKGKYGKN